MKKIKKGCSWKKIVILVLLTFLLNPIAYALRIQHITESKGGRERLIKTIGQSLRRKAIKILFPGLRDFLYSRCFSIDTFNRYLKDINVLDDRYFTLDIEPGTVFIFFTRHTTSSFKKLEAFLDRIFDKALAEDRRVVFYIEVAVPDEMKEIDIIFPDLDFKRIFKDPSYIEHFNNMVKKRHKWLCACFDEITKRKIDVLPIHLINVMAREDSEEEQEVYTSQLSYISKKVCSGCNIKLIPEQSEPETYLAGLRNAQKGRSGRYQDVLWLRDLDFSQLLYRTSTKDDYIIVIRGTQHVPLIDILKERGFQIRPFIRKEVLQYVYSSLQNLAKFLPEYLEISRKMQQFL